MPTVDVYKEHYRMYHLPLADLPLLCTLEGCAFRCTNPDILQKHVMTCERREPRVRWVKALPQVRKQWSQEDWVRHNKLRILRYKNDPSKEALLKAQAIKRKTKVASGPPRKRSKPVVPRVRKGQEKKDQASLNTIYYQKWMVATQDDIPHQLLVRTNNIKKDMRERNYEWLQRHPEKTVSDPLHLLEVSYQHDDDMKGRHSAFILYLVTQSCYYCGTDSTQIQMGIDRVVNTLPYMKGNLVPCCYICNSMKSNRTLEDFVTLTAKVTQKQQDPPPKVIQSTSDMPTLKWNQRLSDMQRGATRRDYEYTLTVKDLEILNDPQTQCFYCGVYRAQCRLGIDRQDNDQGYIPENCVPACYACNSVKGDRSLSVFFKQCAQISQVAPRTTTSALEYANHLFDEFHNLPDYPCFTAKGMTKYHISIPKPEVPLDVKMQTYIKSMLAWPPYLSSDKDKYPNRPLLQVTRSEMVHSRTNCSGLQNLHYCEPIPLKDAVLRRMTFCRVCCKDI